MRNKMPTIFAAIVGLAMMSLQGCFYSSRAPAPYYGGPAYGGPAYSAYGWNRPVNRRCSPRTGNCTVCDAHGHHCRVVPWG
jgi:hypothetical protein